MSDINPMIPLQESWAANELESDNKELFIKLYKDELQELADEINVYGAPHLGPSDLIARYVTMDGLALLNDQDEARMLAVFKAWRHMNPERGLHFLRFYLRILFPGSYSVYQMYASKTAPYPTVLKQLDEIIGNGELETDYFLTSRIRVDLVTEIVQDRILRALRTTLAARFLLDVRIIQSFKSETAAATVGGSTNILYFSGTCSN